MSTLRRRKTWNQEKFTDDANEVWWVHKRETCAGSYCAIHNPSEHPLKDAPLILRHGSPFSFKPHGFAERFCEHGIGHSDPDSVVFYSQQGDDSTGIHGCDGCCSGSYEKLNPPKPNNNVGWVDDIVPCLRGHDPEHNAWDCVTCNPYGLGPEDIY